jgi:hypothetical protein
MLHLLSLRLSHLNTVYQQSARRFHCSRVVIRLKLATGPYKAARDAYVAATATYTKSLYE